MLKRINRIMGSIWRSIRNHWQLKVISLIFGVLLWSYVLAQTNPIRDRETTNVPITYQGTLELEAKDLALTDPNELNRLVSVKLEVQQSNLSKINNNNIQVIGDLSSIQTPGTYDIRLIARTDIGSVIQVTPQTIKVRVESLKTKWLPIETRLVGALDSSHYVDTPVLETPQVEVKGPKSEVDRIVRAYVNIPVNQDVETNASPLPIILMEKIDNADADMAIDPLVHRLNITSTIVHWDVLSVRTLPINQANVTRGKVKKDFSVPIVKVSPEEVRVAGKLQDINQLVDINIEQVDITDLDMDMEFLQRIQVPEGVRLLSSDIVKVNVSITPDRMDKTFQVPVNYTNKPTGLRIKNSVKEVKVVLKGPVYILRDLQQTSITVEANLSGVSAGTSTITLLVSIDEPTGLVTGSAEPQTVEVTLN